MTLSKASSVVGTDYPHNFQLLGTTSEIVLNIRYMEEEKNKHTKHDKKRVRIPISLYHSHQVILKDKLGFIPNATQARDILLFGEVNVKTRNVDPLLPEVLTQLRKIGNNINQMANLANAKKEAPAEGILRMQLMQIHDLIDHLYKIKK